MRLDFEGKQIAKNTSWWGTSENEEDVALNKCTVISKTEFEKVKDQCLAMINYNKT